MLSPQPEWCFACRVDEDHDACYREKAFIESDGYARECQCPCIAPLSADERFKLRGILEERESGGLQK